MTDTPANAATEPQSLLFDARPAAQDLAREIRARQNKPAGKEGTRANLRDTARTEGMVLALSFVLGAGMDVSLAEAFIADPGNQQARQRTEPMALNEIAEILRDPSYNHAMLEDIADIIRSTGRSTENYPDDRPTWVRH